MQSSPVRRQGQRLPPGGTWTAPTCPGRFGQVRVARTLGITASPRPAGHWPSALFHSGLQTVTLAGRAEVPFIPMGHPPPSLQAAKAGSTPQQGTTANPVHPPAPIPLPWGQSLGVGSTWRSGSQADQGSGSPDLSLITADW